MHKRLKILHIACIENHHISGVCTVVPQHIQAQEKEADTFLLNVAKEPFDGIDNQLVYSGKESLRQVCECFGTPDLAVFHEVYAMEYLPLARQLRRLRIPYIILPHGSLTDHAQSKSKLKKKLANVLFFDRFIRHSLAIQCLSESEKERTHRKHKFVASNGIYIPEKKKTAFAQDVFRFVFIGRLDAYYKGLDLLIAAAKDCKPFLKENNCEIYIYGPDRVGRFAHVQSLIEKNDVADVVFLYHEVLGEDKEAVLLDANCFIQVSRSEGMPVGILEAMGYGLPCAVSYGTGLGQMIADGDLGWVCEADEASIADMLQTVIRERQTLPEKSERSLNFIKENFTWETVSSAALKEYEKRLTRAK